MFDHRNKVTNEYILEELRPYRDKTFAAIVRRNEALNQAQIAQQALFDFDFDSTGSQDYQQLALEFLQLYHQRTGTPLEDRHLQNEISKPLPGKIEDLRSCLPP